MFFTGTDTVLVGYTEDTKVDLGTAAAKFEAVRASLAEIGIDRPARLLDMLVMELEPGDGMLGQGLLNTDNHPYIEYSAQKSALDYQTDANQRVLLKYFSDIVPPASRRPDS